MAKVKLRARVVRLPSVADELECFYLERGLEPRGNTNADGARQVGPLDKFPIHSSHG